MEKVPNQTPAMPPPSPSALTPSPSATPSSSALTPSPSATPLPSATLSSLAQKTPLTDSEMHAKVQKKRFSSSLLKSHVTSPPEAGKTQTIVSSYLGKYAGLPKNQLKELINNSVQSNLEKITPLLIHEDANNERDACEKIVFKHELLNSTAIVFVKDNELYDQDLDTLKTYVNELKIRYNKKDITKTEQMYLRAIIGEITPILIYRERGIIPMGIRYEKIAPLDLYVQTTGKGGAENVEPVPLKDKVENLNQNGQLKFEIQSRNREIEQRVAHFARVIQKDTPENTAMRLQVTETSDKGELTRMQGGGGGAYLLKDAAGVPRFVVKPHDEDALCLNNSKNMANPLADDLSLSTADAPLRIRSDVPLYQSAQNEALASDLAALTGLDRVTPPTVGVVLYNEQFYNMTDQFDSTEYLKDLEAGINPKRKFCSAQAFIPDSEDFSDYLKRKGSEGFTIDPTDFEMANIFTWLTGSLDGHLGNYRVFRSADSGEGPQEILHLRKIDNGLICGDGTTRSVIENGLKGMLGDKQLSKEGIEIIKNLPVEDIVARMRFWGKSELSIAWTLHRIQAIQSMIENGTIALKDIENQFVKLSRLRPDQLPALQPRFQALLRHE